MAQPSEFTKITITSHPPHTDLGNLLATLAVIVVAIALLAAAFHVNGRF